jgi:hypothetical protein
LKSLTGKPIGNQFMLTKLFPPPNVSNPGHKFNVATIIEIYSETDCFKRKMA